SAEQRYAGRSSSCPQRMIGFWSAGSASSAGWGRCPKKAGCGSPSAPLKMKPVEQSETREPSSFRRKLAMFWLALLTFLLLAELGLRIFWHNPYQHDDPDHLIPLRIAVPGRHYILDRSLISKNPPVVQFRVNERGYIQPSHQFDKPDVTIAFLGGSTAEWLAVHEPPRLPAVGFTLIAHT